MMKLRAIHTRLAISAIAVLTMISVAGCESRTSTFAPLTLSDTPRRTLSVFGEGVATAKPSLARMNLGVEIVAPNIADAMRSNSTRMSAVIARVKALGIADKDIQTTSLSVNVERDFQRAQGQITGYRVANTVIIVVRDLEKVSTVLDQAIQAGANNVHGISFGIEDTSKLEAEARAKAVANALARADDIAKLNGLVRGDVISMNEGASPITLGVEAAGLARGMGGGGTPIESGTLEIHVRVQITYSVR